MNPECIATYQLPVHPGFGFDQAAEVVPSIADLGTSHPYASPYLQRRHLTAPEVILLLT